MTADLADDLSASERPSRTMIAIGRNGIKYDMRKVPLLRRAVLLVHDDEAARDMLRDALMVVGIAVQSAGSVTEAVAMLNRYLGRVPASVVVTDYVLRENTAVDLLVSLPREHRALVVSAHPDTARIAAMVRVWAPFMSTPLPDDVEGIAHFVAYVRALLDDVTPESQP